ncbi:hypothetical protein ACFYP4_16480 [Streptomyces sp. NPDC005551]|uniref:hypothetical protein n=1 Tax=Streptomyces sp. NPDC005551 TaxID=3364725 RepID=UPI00368D5172
MSTSAPQYEPPTCSTANVGPCARCQRPTQKHGPGASPLRNECLAPVRALQRKPATT